MKHKNIILFVVFGLVVGAGFGYMFRLKNTKPNPGDAARQLVSPTTVAVVGDMSCPPAKPVTDTTCQMQAVATAVENIQPAAVLIAGDIQYDNGELVNFQAVFNKLWSAGTKLYPVPGNHEYNTAGAAGYYAYFTDYAGVNGQGYYDFDLGNWKVYALNSNCEYVGGCGEGSAQATWLESELSKNDNRCSIAMWHHPRFTSGPHSDQDSTGRGEYFWTLLDKYHADIILNGHDHLYERFARQHADTSKDNLSGVRQFTVGSGGKSLYKFKEVLPNQEFGDDENFGFLKLELYDNNYAWQFIDTAGNVIDSGRNNCSQNYKVRQ